MLELKWLYGPWAYFLFQEDLALRNYVIFQILGAQVKAVRQSDGFDECHALERAGMHTCGADIIAVPEHSEAERQMWSLAPMADVMKVPA